MLKLCSALLLILSMTACNVIIDKPSSYSLIEKDSIISQAKELRTLGRKSRERSNFSEAVGYQTKALDLSLSVGDTMGIVRDYNQLGTTFRRMGRLEAALGLHMNALSYAEQSSDTSAQAMKNLVVSLNGLGNVHLSLSNLDDALRCFRRALQGETQLCSDLGCAINYANIGSIHERQGQLDSARYYYDLSMECNQRCQNVVGISLCHNYFGHLYETEGRMAEAEQEYLQSAEIMAGNEDLWHVYESYSNLASLYLVEHREQEALSYIRQCLDIAQQVHSFELLEQSHLLMSRYHQAMGHDRQALESYLLSNAYEDSISSPEEERLIRDICIDYERDKAQRETEAVQRAFDSAQRLHYYTRLFLAIAIVLFLIVIGALIYAYQTRLKRLETLRAVESMRTTFFTNITHEFRTPLTVILGMAQQLRDTSITPQQRAHFLTTIERQGHALLDLVAQLLGISKLMSGCGQAEWRHGDLVSFLRCSISGYTDFASCRGVQLTFHCDQPSIPMDFVPEYMDRIVRNLLSNSFKYTPSGGHISVEARPQEKHLVLEFVDTGCGIPLEDRPHIFELFYQGVMQRREGSTGIGLPFVRQMVHFMGGIIEAADNLPHGAIMRIVLPIHNSGQYRTWDIASDANKMLSGHASSDQDSDFYGHDDETSASYPTILIVEDNPDIAEYERLLLCSRYNVITATEGYEALRKAQQQVPQLVITDLMMPGMDGNELVRTLRQSEALSDVPIIIVSARSEDEVRLRSLEDGADAFLLKPFRHDELVLMVDKFIERCRQLRNSVKEMDAKDDPLLQTLQEVLLRRLERGSFDIDAIAADLSLNRVTLNQRIKNLTGISARAYIMQFRMSQALDMLQHTTQSVGEIAFACGFEDTSYFTRVFRQFYDKTPSQSREEAANS